jgi:hypothetical protein
MSTIRRQSVISSVMVYAGFALGFLNTYLFTRQGGFTKEQFGLTAMFVAIGHMMYSVASVGTPKKRPAFLGTSPALPWFFYRDCAGAGLQRPADQQDL